MSGKPIQITASDLERLKKLVQDAQRTSYRKSIYLSQLQTELRRAEVVEGRSISAGVVTMNSRVRLEDVDTGEESVYTVVFPDDANAGQGKVSILAPIGTAMLGYEVGDIFEWDVPAGKRRWKVKQILYQPEAAGDFNL